MAIAIIVMANAIVMAAVRMTISVAAEIADPGIGEAIGVTRIAISVMAKCVEMTGRMCRACMAAGVLSRVVTRLGPGMLACVVTGVTGVTAGIAAGMTTRRLPVVVEPGGPVSAMPVIDRVRGRCRPGAEERQREAGCQQKGLEKTRCHGRSPGCSIR